MSPQEKIGAFFDIDGTLLPAPSLEWRFIGWLIAHDYLGGSDVARWLGRFANKIWRNPHGATLSNKMYLSGLRETLADGWGELLTRDSLPLFARGAERVAWHLSQGHRVFFVSGTLAPLARIAARLLSDEIEIRATELEVCEGRWTGRLAADHMRGEAKARAMCELAEMHRLDLSQSYAYGNNLLDLPMLESVGRPVAVNPSVGLERIACSDGESSRLATPNFGWQVCIWRTPSTISGADDSHSFATK